MRIILSLAVSIPVIGLIAASATAQNAETVTLRLAPKHVSCLLKHSSQISDVKTSLVIIAPSYCPVIPFKDYDPKILASNTPSVVPVAYVFSKKRAICVLRYLKENRRKLLNGDRDRVMEVSIGC